MTFPNIHTAFYTSLKCQILHLIAVFLNKLRKVLTVGCLILANDSNRSLNIRSKCNGVNQTYALFSEPSRLYFAIKYDRSPLHSFDIRKNVSHILRMKKLLFFILWLQVRKQNSMILGDKDQWARLLSYRKHQRGVFFEVIWEWTLHDTVFYLNSHWVDEVYFIKRQFWVELLLRDERSKDNITGVFLGILYPFLPGVLYKWCFSFHWLRYAFVLCMRHMFGLAHHVSKAISLALVGTSDWIITKLIRVLFLTDKGAHEGFQVLIFWLLNLELCKILAWSFSYIKVPSTIYKELFLINLIIYEVVNFAQKIANEGNQLVGFKGILILDFFGLTIALLLSCPLKLRTSI